MDLHRKRYMQAENPYGLQEYTPMMWSWSENPLKGCSPKKKDMMLNIGFKGKTDSGFGFMTRQ